ncbi:MAG: phosphodiester glycosidase family protein [Candidatus Sumerlaeia bacterium]|nr:phosphodiester glycosidase family protein [Candidatus Sumerlaeia bacterium]
MNTVLRFRCGVGVLMLAGACMASATAVAQYYPAMVYGEKQQLAPGVTWQVATNASPLLKVHVFEVDMTNRNVEVMPVFKAAGNVSGSANERTSSMAIRTDAIAAINAGYYNTTNMMTNSYTVIDGVFIGGAGTAMTPENNRSVLGFSGNHQAIPKRTKVSNAFVPANATDWDKIVDFIAGRGHFVTSNGTLVTQDNEGTTASHNAERHPRTAIGYSLNPYKAYLVAVDGRQASISVGMTYEELGKLMADLGIEQSISLDGGGSTTAWVKGQGIVNSPSDGSERSVVSAWVVVPANTMDNTVEEVTTTGTWTTDTTSAQRYYVDQLVTSSTAGAASVTWTPALEQSGYYKVYAWWTSEAGRATAAPYQINHANGTATATANQAANGGKWNLLGVWPFEAGTAGSVVLTNAATGTVSADAVRFVRIASLPDPIEPGYTILSTLYQNDFTGAKSTDFTVSNQVAGDNSINFSYDYSTYAQQAGGFPTTIPQSPSSTGSDTRAMRVAANLANGVANGITATLTSIAPQDNMRITFDAWINYNGGAGGGSGSTEFMSFGGSADPARAAMAASAYGGTHQPFNGFYFAIAGEGGASQDYRYHDGNGVGAATGNNAARANFLGTAAVDHSEMTGIFPVGQFETNGAPGKAWLRWEVVLLQGNVRLIVTKPDNTQVLLCDWFAPTANATKTGLLPHLGTFDPFAGVANPVSDNFVLYDNLKVEAIAPVSQSRVGSWTLYQ